MPKHMSRNDAARSGQSAERPNVRGIGLVVSTMTAKLTNAAPPKRTSAGPVLPVSRGRARMARGMPTAIRFK